MPTELFEKWSLVADGEQSPYGHCIAQTPTKAANRCESLADTLEQIVERGETPCPKVINRLRMIACDLRAMQELLYGQPGDRRESIRAAGVQHAHVREAAEHLIDEL